MFLKLLVNIHERLHKYCLVLYRIAAATHVL